jgi:hypothetical protein
VLAQQYCSRDHSSEAAQLGGLTRGQLDDEIDATHNAEHDAGPVGSPGQDAHRVLAAMDRSEVVGLVREYGEVVTAVAGAGGDGAGSRGRRRARGQHQSNTR